MPQLRSLQEKYSRQMVVLGVDAGERGETEASRAALGAAAAKRNELNYPVLLNGDRVMEQYEANGFPATYLIDPAGRIVAAQVGMNPDLWPRVEAVVAAYQPPDGAEPDSAPRKAAQILHALDFPAPPGPHEWVVGREVVIRFHRPQDVTADLVAFSVDGKPVAVFGPDSAYTWDATAVSDGVHKLRVAAQTASGRETWAVDQTVIVDNRTPREVAPPPRPAKAAVKTRKIAKARKNPN